jgi:hypothetical protein
MHIQNIIYTLNTALQFTADTFFNFPLVNGYVYMHKTALLNK